MYEIHGVIEFEWRKNYISFSLTPNKNLTFTSLKNVSNKEQYYYRFLSSIDMTYFRITSQLLQISQNIVYIHLNFDIYGICLLMMTCS